MGAWGTTDEKDHSFSIECHSDQVPHQSINITFGWIIITFYSQVKIDCCKTITLKASPNGPIATHQGGVLGDYIKVMPQCPPPKKKKKNMIIIIMIKILIIIIE